SVVSCVTVLAMVISSATRRAARPACLPSEYQHDTTSSANEVKRRSRLALEPLDRPFVTVGIGEVDEPPPVEIDDLARFDASLGVESVRGLDVVGDHLHAFDRSRRGVGNSLADRDRASGPRRSELHEAKLVADGVIV